MKTKNKLCLAILLAIFSVSASNVTYAMASKGSSASMAKKKATKKKAPKKKATKKKVSTKSFSKGSSGTVPEMDSSMAALGLGLSIGLAALIAERRRK